MAIAIAAPTGHIGGRLVEKLIAAGADLTVLVRHPERLPEEVRRKAKVAQVLWALAGPPVGILTVALAFELPRRRRFFRAVARYAESLAKADAGAAR